MPGNEELKQYNDDIVTVLHILPTNPTTTTQKPNTPTINYPFFFF